MATYGEEILNWQIVDWNYPVEVWENITLRLEELIKKELGGANF